MIGKLWSELTTRSDSATVPSYLHSIPDLKFALSLLPNGYFRPAYAVYSRVSYIVQQLTGDLEEGIMTPVQAAKSFDQQVKSLVGDHSTVTIGKPMSRSELRPLG